MHAATAATGSPTCCVRRGRCWVCGGQQRERRRVAEPQAGTVHAAASSRFPCTYTARAVTAAAREEVLALAQRSVGGASVLADIPVCDAAAVRGTAQRAPASAAAAAAARRGIVGSSSSSHSSSSSFAASRRRTPA